MWFVRGQLIPLADQTFMLPETTLHSTENGTHKLDCPVMYIEVKLVNWNPDIGFSSESPLKAK